MSNTWVNLFFTAKGAKKTASEIKGVGVASTVANKSVRGLATSLGALTAGFGLLQAIRVVSDFGQEMATVRAITGATNSEFEKLRATAKFLGAETRFSASQAAEAMKFLGQAGFSTNAILNSVEGTLRLAQAGALDLGTAADIASNVLTGFGLATSEAGRVVDVLAKAASSSNTNVTQLGEALKFVAPVAAGLGISVEETVAAIGKLSDAGIQATNAGTALRLIMAKMVSVTPAATRALAAMGLQVSDINPRVVGFTGAIENLANAGATIEDMFEIFEIRGGPAADILKNNTFNLQEFSSALNNATGSAKEMAEIMDDTLKGAFLRNLSAMQDLIISIGDLGFTESLKDLADGFASSLLKISRNMEYVSKWAITLAPAMALIFSGGAVALVSTFVSAMGTLAGIVGGLSLGTLLLNPITLIAGAVGTLLGYMYAFRKEIKLFGEENLLLIDGFMAIKEWIQITYGAWVDWANDAYDAMVSTNEKLQDAIDKFPLLRDAIDKVTESGKDRIKNYFAFPDIPTEIDRLLSKLPFVPDVTLFDDFRDQVLRVFRHLVEDQAIKRMGKDFTLNFAGISLDTQQLALQQWSNYFGKLQSEQDKALAAARQAAAIQRAQTFSDAVASVFPRQLLEDGITANLNEIGRQFESGRIREGSEYIKELVRGAKEASEIAAETNNLKKITLRIDHDIARARERGLIIANSEVETLKKYSILAQDLAGAQKLFSDSVAAVFGKNKGPDLTGIDKFFGGIRGEQEVNRLIENQRRMLDLRKALTLEERTALEIQFLREDLAIRNLTVTDETLKKYGDLIIATEKANLSFTRGATEALYEYKNLLEDVGTSAFNLVSGAFQGMEDALVNFVQTGKLEFKDLIDDMLNQLIRLAVQQSIMKPLLGIFGFENGGAVNIQGFAKGGVVNQPTLFQFAHGGSVRNGVMGEAGTEGILPLRRMANGDMGVQASGMGGGAIFAPKTEVNVEVKGNATPDMGNQIGADVARQMDRMLENKMVEFLRKQNLPGNELNKRTKF